MDMQEKDRCDSLKSEEKKEYKDWLLSNPPPSVSQGAHISSTSCSSVPMDDPFSTGLWSLSTKSTDLDLCKNSNPVTVNSRFNVEWPPDSLSTGDAGILNHNLSHFPADSAFIERAAKFSCFSTSDLGGMMNPFDLAQQHGACANASRENSGAQLVEAGKDDASLSFDHGSRNVSLVKEQKERRDESNQAIVAGDSSSKWIGAVKRKRPNEDMPLHQAKLTPQTSGNLELDNNSPDLTNFKPKGKQVKESNESSKDDFIHIRARRGQATNSHSLAERVRREKINERMKLLQDLVPGCSKVTGKAVMLDEIINYVQSLQQQVEFLSMKLAAINPRLDIDIDTVLSKYLLSSNNGPSVATGFSSNLVHPQLHLSQQGLVQTGLSCIVNPPDILRRPINAQLTAAQGYKEPKTQVPNGWDEEFHNVMQMTSSNDMNLNSHRLQ